MSKDIILIGFGENARVIEAALAPQRTIKGYLDDAKVDPQVIGRIDDIGQYVNDYDFFITIGNNQARQNVYQRLKERGVSFINAVHAQAFIEPGVKLGENVFVGAQSIINVGATIGNNVFINTRCLIEHDNNIGDHVHLAPGVITGGGASVGPGTFVGLGAIINDHVSVGTNTIIGSGAVVIEDIPSNVTAVGVPAKVIKQHQL